MTPFNSCKEAAAFYRKHRMPDEMGPIVYGEGDLWFYTWEPGDGTGWELALSPFPTRAEAEAARDDEQAEFDILEDANSEIGQ